MADTDSACTPAESVAAGDVHVGKEALASCDALKGGEVAAHGDTAPVTSENGVAPALTETTEETTTSGEAAGPTVTETCADTTDSSSQTGTKRKTDDVGGVPEAGEEVKKAKKDEQSEVVGSVAAVTDDTKSATETNGKPRDGLPADEIVKKTVDDVVNADQAVEAV